MKTSHKALFLIIIFIVIIGVVLGSAPHKKTFTVGGAQPWYAVHLANGQVYFGGIQSITPDTITLENTYYLESYTAPAQEQPVASSTSFQVRQQTAPQQIYNLTHRGENDNMKTDNTLYLDRHAVLFWERLSPEAPMAKWLEKASTARN